MNSVREGDGRYMLMQSKQMSFEIARRLDVAIWVFDIDAARIVHANEAACRIWGAESEEELCGRNLGRDMSPTVAKRLKQYQTDFMTADASFTELWTIYPNGDPRSVMVTYRGFPLADGRIGMQCETVGASEDKPENLRSAEALLHTDVMITLFSRAGPPLYLNPAARNAFAGPTDEFEHLFVDSSEYRLMMAQIDIVGEHRCVSKLSTAYGLRWFDISVKNCSDAVTGKPAILMTAIDVTELKEARDTARHLADRDQLTGLFNRAYLQSHLAKFSGSSERQHALVFFDVDRFKQINDLHGHDAGDTVLKAIAKRATKVFRSGDLVARLGGDEFVILVEDFDTIDQLRSRIDRLRRTITDPIMHFKTRIDTSVSVGFSVFSASDTDLNSVLREADVALYASKQAGRDCVTLFTEAMGRAAQARDQMEVELKQAIKDDQFVLHYQPRLDIKSGKVIGAEGLVRWRHPERGLVGPSEFISVCEDTGLIDKLGRRILYDGSRQAIEWHQAGIDIDVSLNISPRQFSGPGLIHTLADIASKKGFPWGRIELEVTENVLIGDPEEIAQKLKVITRMGYKVAIDDFGTGYSNLSYISRFPLTCLKIDRTFVSQLPESGPIVQLILTLGEQIDATVVCEGVETQEQFDWLAKHNCAQAQGHLIATPMDKTSFEAFMAERR